jgi:DNA-binding NtrC family response regulator
VRGISGSALKILSSYWWPGNIRELENLIERLVAVSDKEWITDEDLPLEYHFAKLDSAPSGRNALPGGLRHLRAQLHPAGAREVGLERHGHRPLPRHSPEHAQAQDGAARPARHRAEAARRLSRPGGPASTRTR